MPKISEFYGIAIYMYYRDHAPPHFHARYGSDDAEISIRDGAVLSGKLAPRALGLVIEWAMLHRDELLQVWDEARAHQPLSQIEPLR